MIFNCKISDVGETETPLFRDVRNVKLTILHLGSTSIDATPTDKINSSAAKR